MHPAENATSGPVRVMVVENHEDTLICLRRHLEGEGYVVTVARAANEAMAQLREELPDVLLCDIGLPDLDGCEMLRRMAGAKPGLCIAMSGYGRVLDLERSRAAGFDHHLVKPFLPSHLDDLLALAAI